MNLKLYKKKFIYFLYFILLFFLFCEKQKPSIQNYLNNSLELIDFCKEMVPCVKEEISHAFSNLPQQKEYLLSKTSLQNCQYEQSVKLNQILNLNPEQILNFQKDWEQYIKDFMNAKKHNNINTLLNNTKYKFKSTDNTIENLFFYLNNDQKEILTYYKNCIEETKKSKTCIQKKEILKNNIDCTRIFNNRHT